MEANDRALRILADDPERNEPAAILLPKFDAVLCGFNVGEAVIRRRSQMRLSAWSGGVTERPQIKPVGHMQGGVRAWVGGE